jgi:predicted nuclease of restriction endonuclease-like (RecB) superfamily
LVADYGSGYSQRNLANMIQFVERFPDPQIVGTLSQQLTWSHFVRLVPLEDPLQRDFYAEMCRLERWSVRTLHRKIAGMLFQRTAISKKPDKLIRRELDDLRAQDRLSPDLVFRDPYFLDFLGLKDTYSERDLETAILRELESFLLELGTDFSFVARQKRMTIDGRDYHVDLLFYHRNLRRLVAIDLSWKLSRPPTRGRRRHNAYVAAVLSARLPAAGGRGGDARLVSVRRTGPAGSRRLRSRAPAARGHLAEQEMRSGRTLGVHRSG